MKNISLRDLNSQNETVQLSTIYLHEEFNKTEIQRDKERTNK